MPAPPQAQALLDQIGTGRMGLAELQRLLPQAEALDDRAVAYVLHHLLMANCLVREMNLAQSAIGPLLTLANRAQYDADAASAALALIPRPAPAKTDNPEPERRREEITDDTPIAVLSHVRWWELVIKQITQTLPPSADPALCEHLRRAFAFLPPGKLALRGALAALLEDPALKAQIIAERVEAEADAGPLCQQEVRLILAAPEDLWPRLLRASGRRDPDDAPGAAWPPEPLPLLEAPGYLDFAQEVFATAHQRLADIHSGAVPFAPDKAFPLGDAHLIGRIASIGLSSDAPWCRDRLRDIWMMAAEAPDPKKKSVPSQSITTSFANATVAFPLAYAVDAMAEVLQTLRHAGLEKKLKRLIKQAQTALAQRPDLIAQLPADAPSPKRLKTPVRKSVEYLLRSADFMPRAEFDARFIKQADLRDMGEALIWEAEDGRTLLPKVRSGQTVWRDVNGSEGAAPADLRLWHPVEAEPALREAWRVALRDDQISQPFPQAHREHYRRASTEMRQEVWTFAEIDVEVHRIIAVARSLGWREDYDAFVAQVGPWTFRQPLGTHHIYTGAFSNGRLGPLCLVTPGATLPDVPNRVLSEVLRTVDLFAALGQADQDRYIDHRILGRQTIEVRRQILGWVFKAAFEAGRLTFGPTTAQVGDAKVHLATGRATRAGDPLPTPNQTIKPPWLPYGDETLRKIARHLQAILTEK